VTTPRHVIKGQVLELGLPSPATAQRIQDTVSRIYRENVVPVIESCCNEVATSGVIHRFDSLCIDVGAIPIDELETELPARTAARLRDLLKIEIACLEGKGTPAGKPVKDITAVPAYISQLELFEHFINTGTLPWWANEMDAGELDENLHSLVAVAPDELADVIIRLVDDAAKLKRLVYQFSDRALLSVAAIILRHSNPAIRRFISVFIRAFLLADIRMKYSNNGIKLALWREVFPLIITAASGEADLSRFNGELLVRLSRRLGVAYQALARSVMKSAERLGKHGLYLKNALSALVAEASSKRETAKERIQQSSALGQLTEKLSTGTEDLKQLYEQGEADRELESLPDLKDGLPASASGTSFDGTAAKEIIQQSPTLEQLTEKLSTGAEDLVQLYEQGETTRELEFLLNFKAALSALVSGISFRGQTGGEMIKPSSTLEQLPEGLPSDAETSMQLYEPGNAASELKPLLTRIIAELRKQRNGPENRSKRNISALKRAIGTLLKLIEDDVFNSPPAEPPVCQSEPAVTGDNQVPFAPGHVSGASMAASSPLVKRCLGALGKIMQALSGSGVSPESQSRFVALVERLCTARYGISSAEKVALLRHLEAAVNALSCKDNLSQSEKYSGGNQYREELQAVPDGIVDMTREKEKLLWEVASLMAVLRRRIRSYHPVQQGKKEISPKSGTESSAQISSEDKIRAELAKDCDEVLGLLEQLLALPYPEKEALNGPARLVQSLTDKEVFKYRDRLRKLQHEMSVALGTAHGSIKRQQARKVRGQEPEAITPHYTPETGQPGSKNLTKRARLLKENFVDKGLPDAGRMVAFTGEDKNVVAGKMESPVKTRSSLTDKGLPDAGQRAVFIGEDKNAVAGKTELRVKAQANLTDTGLVDTGQKTVFTGEDESAVTGKIESRIKTTDTLAGLNSRRAEAAKYSLESAENEENEENEVATVEEWQYRLNRSSNSLSVPSLNNGIPGRPADKRIKPVLVKGQNLDGEMLKIASHGVSRVGASSGGMYGSNFQERKAEKRHLVAYRSETIKPSDEIYIHNAGLVICWPFLNRFFESVSLVQEGLFINSVASERAVHLLQYLVDGSLETPEHELPLNKVICGRRLAEPIARDFEISEPESLEAENLLQSVIRNWPALGNISIEGFQVAFLQRRGVLMLRNGDWLVQVERQTHDILLDKLDWTISIIRLPWMDNLIYTEW